MKRILLLNDMDGLCADWRGYVLDKHFPGQTIEWLNHHERRLELLTEVYHKDPELFMNLPVLDGFMSYWHKLQKEYGDYVEFGWLTADGGYHPSPADVFNHKYEWLRASIPLAHSDGVFGLVEQSSEKPEALSEYLDDYDHVILVDDFKRTIDAVKALNHDQLHGVWFNDNWNLLQMQIRSLVSHLLP